MRRFHVAAAVAALTLGTSAAQAQTYDVQIAPFEDPEGRSLAALVGLLVPLAALGWLMYGRDLT